VTLSLRGRAFFVTRDAGLVTAQLEGRDLPLDLDAELADDVSTDEMAPARASYYFDERLAAYCLTGFRGGSIGLGAVERGGFEVLVGGENFGCGSSRETAPHAQLLCGIRLVVARSFGRIYRQNAQNIGLFATTDFSLLARLQRGEALEPRLFVADADPITHAMAREGGLLAYARARRFGRVTLPSYSTPARPQTLVEKIIARHAVRDARGEEVGVRQVSPGQSLFVRADWRFSHEYVTPMADALLRRAFGEDARVQEPERVLLFRDHLTFVREVLSDEARQLPLLEQAELLPRAQARFAERQGVRLLGERAGGGGSEAICHEAMLESFAEPGQVVVGTDSHTSTAGAVGCLAFGVGSTDMAAAWMTRDVRLRVPETVRVELTGRLPPGVTAKDVMLTLFALPLARTGGLSGRVLEFGGDGLATLPLDERATLTNLSVEAGALTGTAEPDQAAAHELALLRGVNAEAFLARALRADPDACYAERVTLPLDTIEPMLALPGDPKRVEPLAQWLESGAPGRIDIAYGGSCTGGKRRDMDLYASVLAPAAARGERVPSHVRFFVQTASESVRRYAAERGYLELFERVGATVLGSACGACIAAGPGTSRSADEVTLSAGSRNFPGRSGPGQVMLASPLVVAASALAGRVARPIITAGTS
jgi:3-isopropylmalate/(R)-2-methylmalate dehydratase large subunit